jgi:hypothetical protein
MADGRLVRMGSGTRRSHGGEREMRFMSFPIVAFGAASLLAGCAAEMCPSGLSMLDPGLPIMFVSGESAIVFETDPIVIVDGGIERDRLVLQVEYKGGCGNHVFGLYATCGFRDGDPPELDLFLSHDAAGDRCLDSVRESLGFDLDRLRQAYRRVYPDDSRLVLRIYGPGVAEPVREISLYRM